MVHHVNARVCYPLYPDIRRRVVQEDLLMGSKPTNDELQQLIESLQKENLRHKKRESALWMMQERLSQILLKLVN